MVCCGKSPKLVLKEFDSLATCMIKKILLILVLTIGASFSEVVKFDNLNGYKNVTVTKVLKDGIRITHSTGAKTIEAKDLSPELRKQFGITTESVVEAKEDKERRERIEKRAILNVFRVTDLDSAISERLEKLKKKGLSDEVRATLVQEVKFLKEKQGLVAEETPVVKGPEKRTNLIPAERKPSAKPRLETDFRLGHKRKVGEK